jgi:Na+/proline symporter
VILGWAVLAAYGAAINLICFLVRGVSSGDDYLIGGRRFSAIFVSFGLFTLVGGGTFVANTSLGFTYGLFGFSLFLGNGLAFLVLGLLSNRVREVYSEYLPISIVDYVHVRYGSIAGWLTFLITFVAFFGLLAMQFIAAGTLLEPILGLHYTQIVIAVGAIATSYLLLTGFRAVMSTDILQGIIIVALIPTLILMVKPTEVRSVHWLPVQIDWIAMAGLTYAGFISAMASSDIWQRAFAARDAQAAKTGFFIGAGVLSFLGFMLIVLGIFAAATGATNADEAFGYMMQSRLPSWATVPLALMILSVIVSTIDTEIFLLGGLAERQIERVQGRAENELAAGSKLGRSRVWVACCASAAVLSAIVYKDLVALYGWLLSLSLTIGPLTFASLFFRIRPVVASGALGLNCVVFIAAALFGQVSVDNSYIIAIPSTILLLFAGLMERQRRKSHAAV